ncbi:MarR family winged helix-turn-helix transcriptional regulator [Duganella sp. CF458]|uniref:MarR family winged helix-turn-helix transcriptional regulator n=1 Tax=Duganella sp. CF458 TaxID=1884368 RepID=UPI000B849260|nr:MarR family winged helix-turn-helix transcriptional regulator [Duganella sp. CF458]
MGTTENTAQLFRDVVRLFVRDQRENAGCMDSGLTVRCHILNELLRDAPLPQQALVDRLGLDKAWISRAVDGLCMEGCVSKEPNQLDKRSVLLSLTPEGKTRATSLNLQLNHHVGELLAHVPPAQRAALHNALQSLHSALNAPNERSRIKCRK